VIFICGPSDFCFLLSEQWQLDMPFSIFLIFSFQKQRRKHEAGDDITRVDVVRRSPRSLDGAHMQVDQKPSAGVEAVGQWFWWGWGWGGVWMRFWLVTQLGPTNGIPFPPPKYHFGFVYLFIFIF
jgi:hypothetical protein